MLDEDFLSMLAAVVIGGIILVGAAFALPAFFRYQAVADAQNQVAINSMTIKQTEQLVEVEKQSAAIRVEQSRGIAEANHIINASLTDRYLQHEAIQAQVQMAGSPNHTQIYIPTGTNGIPLVKTLGPQE